jgi:small subunit ribosomal protein S16
MPVRLRLQRHGRKKRPFYFIVAADSRSPRDGAFIERIGDYNPLTTPATIHIDLDKAFDWVMKGAEPTNTVKKILTYKGILFKKHLYRGVAKGAFTKEVAEQKFLDWINAKTQKTAIRVEKLSEEKQESRRKRIVSEAAVRESKRAKAAQAMAASAPADDASAGDAPAENADNAAE